MKKSELIENGYTYILTFENGVEVWGKIINDTPNNELLHYYHFFPNINETLGEPMIVSRQMLFVGKKLGEVFNISV